MASSFIKAADGSYLNLEEVIIISADKGRWFALTRGGSRIEIGEGETGEQQIQAAVGLPAKR